MAVAIALCLFCCSILTRFSLSFALPSFYFKASSSSLLVSDFFCHYFTLHSTYFLFLIITFFSLSLLISFKKSRLSTCPIFFFLHLFLPIFSSLVSFSISSQCILLIFIPLAVFLFLLTRFYFRVFRRRCYDVGPNQRVIITRGPDRHCSFVVIDRLFIFTCLNLYSHIWKNCARFFFCGLHAFFFSVILIGRIYFLFFTEICFFYRCYLFPNVYEFILIVL